jgi:signal transduction histidine kinase/CheY-like chemotaxis protein
LGVCYYIDFHFPRIFALTGKLKYLDQIQSFVIPGLYIGIVIKLQEVLYRRMTKDLKRQDELLHTVNLVAAELLKSDPADFESDLWNCMGMMAQVVNVDAVYVWKNFIKNGSLHSRFLVEWNETSAPGQDRAVDLTESGENIPGWNDRLIKGECFQGFARNQGEYVRQKLEEQNIVSMLIIPVFLQDYFWGFVGFDDKKSERVFVDDEIAILKSAGLLVANAMQRNFMTESLIRARKEALSSTKAKSNFLANMSHEMRTPMNAIIGMTNIASLSGDIKKKEYCLSKITDASNHLLGVINDILDMSKIEADKFELSLIEFNFEKMLRKAVNVINFRIEEKHQRFMVKLDGDIPFCFLGDDQRLTQVITNLLSNAVKFTPKDGEIRLEAKLLKESEDGFCVIQIEVADTGIGISAEQNERLFESFEQADSNTSRKFGGTGLGLAICKKIVELMGGRIWVESETGKGSRFFFTVHMKKGAEALPRTSRNIRILAADSQNDVLEYFSDIAKRINVFCDTASGKEEAITLIEKNNGYDIYFIDWHMPGIDGLLHYLKSTTPQADGHPSVVVMISASEWASIENEAREAGADKFLSRPVFPSSVSEMIDSCLESSGAKEKKTDTGIVQKFPGRRILLAEDIEINREIVIALLEPFQLDIDCAENGKTAVDMFTQNPAKYDMIFMDVQMPEMDGYTATRAIRALDAPAAKTVPIIAMTANVFTEDVEKCLAAGMNGHMGKPLDFDEVLKKLAQYLL